MLERDSGTMEHSDIYFFLLFFILLLCLLLVNKADHKIATAAHSLQKHEIIKIYTVTQKKLVHFLFLSNFVKFSQFFYNFR